MTQNRYETLIIGAGFGGLGMAHDLKKAGKHDFLILEKAAELGGTWRDNSYPGAECDVNSTLYSYSYAQKSDWDYKWSKQPQILQYMKDFAADNKLNSHMQFHTKVQEASFNAVDGLWTVKTNQGELTCRFLVSAVGQLHYPKTPSFPGKDDFQGAAFHSAQWNHDVDLSGKRVAVIGSAASAVQLIPEVAKSVKKLSIFQRSPNWIVNKGDKAYSGFDKWIARTFPFTRKLNRAFYAAFGEYILYPAIKGSQWASLLLKTKALSDMKKHIKDTELLKTLTPDFPVGAKRILFTDHFYPALARENVELINSGIKKITADGILSVDGRFTETDVIIYATGFYSNPFLMGLDISGRDGKTLAEHWSNGAFAYKGVTTSGFPNLFFLYGPNTNTGHTSIIFKLECQIKYILQLMGATHTQQVEVKPDVENAFNEDMQDRLSNLTWAKVEASWYKDGDKLTNNWPGTAREFQRRLKTVDWGDFI